MIPNARTAPVFWGTLGPALAVEIDACREENLFVVKETVFCRKWTPP